MVLRKKKKKESKSNHVSLAVIDNNLSVVVKNNDESEIDANIEFGPPPPNMTQFSAGFADSVDSSSSWEEQGDLDRKKKKRKKEQGTQSFPFTPKKKKNDKTSKAHVCLPFCFLEHSLANLPYSLCEDSCVFTSLHVDGLSHTHSFSLNHGEAKTIHPFFLLPKKDS
jgi:hypothetical protein